MYSSFKSRIQLALVEKVFLSLLYAVLLILLYRDSVYPRFGYMGFPFFGINWPIASFQLFIIALVSAALPIEFNKVSDLCVWLLFKMVFVPSLVIASLVTHEVSFVQVLLTDIVLAFCILIVAFVSQINATSSHSTLSPGLFWILMSCIGAFFIAFILKDFGFSLGRILDLRNWSEIYDIRYAHMDAAQKASFISNYGSLWLAKVIVPLYWAWGLIKKSRIAISLALAVQLMLFALSAHKSFLFSLVFVYFIYKVASRSESGAWFQRAMVGFTVFSAILFYALDFNIPVDVIVRRVFIVPGMLSGFFIEYYAVHDYAFYAHNFLSNIFDTSYTTSPAFTIGQNYFGNPKTSANVNLWGDAFANMGYVGIIIITCLLSATLVLINAFSANKNLVLTLCLFSVSFWTITETSLTTTFISHGLAFAVIVAALLYREQKNVTV